MDPITTSLKISDIATEIISRLDETQLQYKKLCSAQSINRLLLESGDLTETAVGKVETKLGREHGISGIYREKEDKTYWLPLYNDVAAQYVIDLVYKTYPELKPNAKQTAMDEWAEGHTEVEPTASDLPQEPEEQHREIQRCENCMDYRNHECFGRQAICTDFRYVGTITAEEMEGWPEMGDASFIKKLVIVTGKH